jgi:hypothetical protein
MYWLLERWLSPVRKGPSLLEEYHVADCYPPRILEENIVSYEEKMTIMFVHSSCTDVEGPRAPKSSAPQNHPYSNDVT